ncbi:alpha-amylase [bacterium]|nr:alpha-amylase [bacterium]
MIKREYIHLSKLSEKKTKLLRRYFPFEFHISKKTREKYGFNESLFSITGNVVLSNTQAVRLFAYQINEKRDLKNHPEQAVKAGQLNAMGLIDEILHYVIDVYQEQRNPKAFKNSFDWVNGQFNFEVISKTLTQFIELFPPLVVHQGKVLVWDYMNGFTEGTSNLEIAGEELLLLFLANNNPAFLPFIELFDDTELAKDVPYEVLIGSIIDFFKTQPTFGPFNQFLVDLLRAPVVASPNSFTGQIEYIRDNWGLIISPELMHRILLALDLVKEEEKFGFFEPGISLVPCFKGYALKEYGYEEFESFSQDLDWMSKVVLIAKNVYVWLDQLSKKYKRPINRLDQIPNEELDLLAGWGFTGLWLIGLWERSPASQKIKQICGNPEAVSSAYSIYDYVTAGDLGGEEALEGLKFRAWQRGIRLASDMVPNHMGIYSKWVIEHPDWFVQLNYSPFPSYNFTGPNLSWDDRVGVYIEDGYWTRRDAAVIFKRVDHWTGDVRYIYHGNDGTCMPWNDTAQLNFLRADVREAVIQSILHVARNFPIIRFDAAMTLAKRHYQRLWFPAPGEGGDISSRAGLGMTKEDFDKVFPKEFWREVVDRVTQEVPDTLLLAEAFWLMEGYFVRTLGMHRVYNSAFMNMLKMEENANYRSVIKNVIEFDPEILKRFVNFMNNPDEQTAVAQFGKGDKYFGVAMMMVTMPGLPMFGHGQIEGFTEKYGMEYRKAYWHEEVDWDLVRRHEAEIFPLMKKRHLFSGVENFVLYDFYAPEGWVNEDVFAYSNRVGDEKALVIYHNKYATTKGWIRLSTTMSIKGDKPGEKRLIQKSLAEVLDIKLEERYFYIFKDYKSGLEYIRQGKELTEKGLYVELEAYQHHIFLDFREVCDDDCWYYARLTSFLKGDGVFNLDEAYKEIYFESILIPFKQVINKGMLKRLAGLCCETSDILDKEEILTLFKQNMQVLLEKIKEFGYGSGDEIEITGEVMNLLGAILKIESLNREMKDLKEYEKAVKYLNSNLHNEDKNYLPFWRVLLSWLIIQKLGKIKEKFNYEQQSASWMDKLLFGKIIFQTFKELGCEEQTAKKQVYLLKILTKYPHGCDSSEGDKFAKMLKILEDYEVRAYLNFNWYKDTLWFSKEALEELMYWLFIVSVVNLISDISTDEKRLSAEMTKRYKTVTEILHLAESSGYDVEKMVEMFKE